MTVGSETSECKGFDAASGIAVSFTAFSIALKVI